MGQILHFTERISSLYIHLVTCQNIKLNIGVCALAADARQRALWKF